MVTDANGDYTADVSSLVAPLVITVGGGTYDPDGAGPLGTTTNSSYLYSVSNTRTGIANVTTLTTLALQNAAGASDLLPMFNNWGTTRPSQADIDAAAARVRANLSARLTAAGVPATYNFFNAAFPAVGAGIDAVMDAVTCTTTGSAASFAVSCMNGSTPLPFNLTISTTGFGGSTGGGGGSTGGTLSIPPTSTWLLKMNGAATGTSVAGSQVPATSAGFDTYGRAFTSAGSVAIPGSGVTVSFSNVSVTFTHVGDGSAVGDTVTGRITGIYRMTAGVLGGITIPASTTNIDNTFVWERTM